MNRRNSLVTAIGSPPNGPAITFSYPPPGGMSYGLDVVVTARAMDVVDGDVTSSIRWSSSLDGVLGQGATVRLQPLSVGMHTISATAVDSQGNSTTSDFTFQVYRERPQLSILEPVDFFSVAETNYPFQFRATASDVVDGDISHLITWISSIDGVFGTGGTISAALSTGNHLVEASVVNTGGETSSLSREVQVARWPPTVTITAPRNNTSVVRGTAVTFTGAATDLVDGELGAQLTWRSTRDGLLHVGPSFTTSALTVGSHTIRAEATDSHGQLTRASITVRVTASAVAAAEDDAASELSSNHSAREGAP
jgi:hypothetical protein